jgi:hypothetical protein
MFPTSRLSGTLTIAADGSTEFRLPTVTVSFKADAAKEFSRFTAHNNARMGAILSDDTCEIHLTPPAEVYHFRKPRA